MSAFLIILTRITRRHGRKPTGILLIFSLGIDSGVQDWDVRRMIANYLGKKIPLRRKNVGTSDSCK